MSVAKTIMKMFASICAVIVAVAGLVGIETRIIEAQDAPRTGGGNTSAPRSTEELYSAYCAKCHGADGRAQTEQGQATSARDFTGERWKARTSVEAAAAAIRAGDGQMPAFKRRLSEAQIQALAEYVKSFPH